MSRKHVNREGAVWAVARIVNEDTRGDLPVCYETEAGDWRVVPTNEDIRTYEDKDAAQERADELEAERWYSTVLALPIRYEDQGATPGPDWKAKYEALLAYGEREFGDSFWPGGDLQFCRDAAEAGDPQPAREHPMLGEGAGSLPEDLEGAETHG